MSNPIMEFGEFRVSISQEGDCFDTSCSDQELTVSIEDGGGGAYPVISTARWATEGDELQRLLELVMRSRDELAAAVAAIRPEKGEDDE